MYKLFLSLFALSYATTITAAETQIEVFITGINPRIDSPSLSIGQLKATELMAARGMSVKWFWGRPSGCSTAGNALRLILELLDTAPANVTPAALADTSTYRCPAVTIRLFWDRLQAIERSHPVAHGHFLGFVLTHELVHATGNRSHSDDGLMKSKWTREDIREFNIEEDVTR